MDRQAAGKTCRLANIGYGEGIETLVGDQSCCCIENALLRFLAPFFLSPLAL
jgi:hypothetical protein